MNSDPYTTVGWVVWIVMLAVSVAGWIYLDFVRPRREKRLIELARIVGAHVGFDVDRALADGHSVESILRNLAKHPQRGRSRIAA